MSAPKLTQLLANAPEEEEIEGYLVEEGGKIKAHDKKFGAGTGGGAPLEPIQFTCSGDTLFDEGTVQATLTSGQVDASRLFTDIAYFMDVYFNTSLFISFQASNDTLVFYPHPGLEQQFIYNYTPDTLAHVNDIMIGLQPTYIDANEGVISFCFDGSASVYPYPSNNYDNEFAGYEFSRQDMQTYLVYLASENKWYITVNDYSSGGGNIPI